MGLYKLVTTALLLTILYHLGVEIPVWLIPLIILYMAFLAFPEETINYDKIREIIKQELEKLSQKEG